MFIKTTMTSKARKLLKRVSYVRKVLLLGFRALRLSQPLSSRLEALLEVLWSFPGKFSLFLHSADVFIRDHTFRSVFVGAPWWSDCKFYGDTEKDDNQEFAHQLRLSRVYFSICWRRKRESEPSANCNYSRRYYTSAINCRTWWEVNMCRQRKGKILNIEICKH